ncbi:MAG TPA: hypothetical protein VEC35_04055 [Noviherbaspirillum sp.]|nr:hypothetical protein [Noviherbaspirillum sp.]
MGYHVTILRTQVRQTIPITKAEILELAQIFPEWTYDAEQEALVSAGERVDAPALWFSEGKLWTTNPSDETITSMIALANHLHARVRGDEFETYRTVDETYLHPDDAQEKAEADASVDALIRRTRRKQWLFNAVLFGTLISLILILKKIGFLE